jgi:hypothetical protein
MNMKTKKELFGIELTHYLDADNTKKGEILDGLVRQTKLHRKSLIRAFTKLQLKDTSILDHRGRRIYYTPDVTIALHQIWEASNQCCGELLHPIVSEYIEIFKKDKMWKHNEEATHKLLRMSIATMKRKVCGWVCGGKNRGISSTSPSSIKDRVPLFQGDWKTVSIGNGQIDTVAHCGGSLAGEFMYSCGYVDVPSGWIEYRAQWSKGMQVTQESLESIRLALPWQLVQIHPDCGTEFLNSFVMEWCEKYKIQVTRSRSYHKNDNGYVEQRNGHIARRWLGYDRLGIRDMLTEINEFYILICQYHNHFKAQRLCISTVKLENGKYKKEYEIVAQTPYRRILERKDLDVTIKEKLTVIHETLNPSIMIERLKKLKRDIMSKNRRLMEGLGSGNLF